MSNQENLPSIRLDSTGSALVDNSYHWIPITSETPCNIRMQLINKASKVHASGVIGEGNRFGWTHYCPYPTFPK